MLKQETDTTPAKDSFPFYHQDDEGRVKHSQMTDAENQQRDQDWKDAEYWIEYRKNCGWDEKAARGMLVYNVTQTAKPDDEVSRIFLGYTRTQIDRGMDQMTSGEPDFTFEPFGPSDSKKTILWKHLMRKVLSDSNYRVHQDRFFRDYMAMGCGVFEVYIDYPQRTIRVPNGDGTFIERIVKDTRPGRSKVGIRAVNPMNCWRNPDITDLTQVPGCLKRRVVSWDQFTQEFGRVTLPDGEPKYKNLDKIVKGKYVVLYEYQNELTDAIRIYAESFCNDADKNSESTPVRFGVMIYDKSLKIHQTIENGKLLRCEGHNLLGMCTLRWGTYFDKYDRNKSGEHGVYGMGLPERIEGEDMVLQTIFNIQIDNYRWQNAVALNYQGNSADSYIDIDNNRLVGGELIDGTITPQPLGIYRPNDFGSMKEVLDGSVIPATGINHNQIQGDTSKTAFEFAQRIKMGTASAEQRLSRLESEVFKPVGFLLLSGALTELTVDEWEAMTEEEVEAAKQGISDGTETLEDYKELNGEKPQRRSKQYLKMKGEKIREDFSKTKKRQMKYNADLSKNPNTLVYDKNMDSDTSYIPIIPEYFYPIGYLQHGLQMDVIVDTKRLLGDLKAQDAQNRKLFNDFLFQMKQFNPEYNKINWDSMVEANAEFADIDLDDALIDTPNDEEASMRAKELEYQKSILFPDPNAAPPQVPQQAPAAPNLGTAPTLGGGQPQPQGALEKVATGAL